MNNLEALEKMMAGGKIRQVGWYTNTFYELKDGDIVDQDGDIVETICYDNKSVWEIYNIKKEWFYCKKNFPLLCKVFDFGSVNSLYKEIVDFRHNHFIDSNSTAWDFAEPILSDNLLLLDNLLDNKK